MVYVLLAQAVDLTGQEAIDSDIAVVLRSWTEQPFVLTKLLPENGLWWYLSLATLAEGSFVEPPF